MTADRWLGGISECSTDYIVLVSLQPEGKVNFSTKLNQGQL